MLPISSSLILILAGLCFFASMHHLTGFWILGRRNRSRLAFATLAFMAALSTIPWLMILHAQQVSDLQSALKWDLVIFIPLFLNFIWFSDLYTGYGTRRMWWLFVSSGAALLLIHLTRPYGLVTSGIDGFTDQTLPWGEVVRVGQDRSSTWGILYYLFILGGLWHISRSGRRFYLDRNKLTGRVFLFCVVLGWAVAVHDMLVDFDLFPGLYLAALAVPAFVVFMSIDLALEWRHQEAFYTQLFDSLNDAIFVHDAETGQILQASEASARMYGFRSEEVVGRFVDVLSVAQPEYSAEKALERIRKARDQGPQVFEWLCRRKDGIPFWTEVALRVALVAGKNRVVAVVRDIDERKRNQAALGESQVRFRNIVEASPIGMHFYRLEEGGKLVLTGFNRAAEKILGVDHNRLVGLTLEEVFPSLKDTEVPWRYRLAAKEGVSWHAENIDYRDNRLVGSYEVFAVQTEPGTMAALFLDVSQRLRLAEEQRKIQARLQESQRLESLGVLAGGIAHDFNNLLMAVRGNVESLEVCKGMPTNGDCRKSLESLKLVSDRATDLCRQLLAYAGRGNLTPELLDLPSVVKEIGRVLEVGVSKKAQVDYRFADHLPAVKADAAQIRQVLLNLLTNASEALGEDAGRITVSVEPRVLEVPSDGLPPGNYLCLEVSDNGCGMDEETQARIFEPFFTTKFTGRGLGLAAVQGILRAHGGNIRVKSEGGHGTTMKILLPAAKEKAVVAPRAAQAAKRSFKGRVLLADDEEDVRYVTRRMLERLGLAVDEAANGLEAVAAVRSQGEKYIGVVMDLTMPSLDGIESLRRILVLRPNLSALLISGYGPEETRDRMKDLPNVVLLQKPFGREDLAASLTRAGLVSDSVAVDLDAKLDRETFKVDLARLIETSADIGEFYGELSRLFLRLKGLKYAWLGLLGPDGAQVVPVVESGVGERYLDRTVVRSDESSLGRGPTGEAIRTGQPSFENDISHDPVYAPWREKALAAGFQSSAALPILLNGHVAGTLNLYSAEAGHFNEGWQKFFKEVALLLAEGLRKFRAEGKKV